MTLLATIFAGGEEELAPLIMPPIGFAATAIAIFVALAFVIWSYRDVANRHSDRVRKGTDDSHGAGH